MIKYPNKRASEWPDVYGWNDPKLRLEETKSRFHHSEKFSLQAFAKSQVVHGILC
ncbi:hypothetical protein GCM10008982_20930 [Anoxybacillus voinovskiensis]|nr:hypothetical protein GCM10008982_20930 [Anoxybacillus voinovskiensis]